VRINSESQEEELQEEQKIEDQPSSSCSEVAEANAPDPNQVSTGITDDENEQQLQQGWTSSLPEISLSRSSGSSHHSMASTSSS
jgi:hypothetical protein